ncbi:MAG: hypothetical protein KIS94_00020 [Chitinophagales bacterium]|nr:hypothetical protein [Chitinophagales bacterium]
MDIHLRLSQVETKVRKLINENQSVAAKCSELEKETERLKQLLAEEQHRNTELHNKIKIIKLAQNIGTNDSGNNELTELKRKINEYIKEIDNCMAMLNE